MVLLAGACIVKHPPNNLLDSDKKVNSMPSKTGRFAALNMYASSGQTKIKRLIAFRDEAPFGGGSGMPCGACREFLYQLNEENENTEIMVDYERRETVTLKELTPNRWGKEYAKE